MIHYLWPTQIRKRDPPKFLFAKQNIHTTTIIERNIERENMEQTTNEELDYNFFG